MTEKPRITPATARISTPRRPTKAAKRKQRKEIQAWQRRAQASAEPGDEKTERKAP